MKKLLTYTLVFALTLTLGYGFAFAGNGAPDAKKVFSLNIIGVSGDKNPDMDNNGHRIFVPLEGKAKIELMKGPDFEVLDPNGTGGNAAQLQLPDPGLDPYLVGDTTGKDTKSDYSVYVRPLGKPGGWATITTCAKLLDSNFADLLPGKFIRTLNKACEWDGAFASVEQVGQEITFRDKGQEKFENVTAELLTIVFKVETEAGTVYVRVPIFDPIIDGEYWEYDNDGLKILQVRFYNNHTDVSKDDGTWNNE